MKTLLFLLLSTWATSPYDLYVDDKPYGDLTEITTIPYPKQIQVISKNDLKVEITIITKGRKLVSISTRTNEVKLIGSYKGVNKIHIKVYDRNKPFTQYLDIEKEK